MPDYNRTVLRRFLLLAALMGTLVVLPQGQARTVREAFQDHFGQFLTLAGAEYGLKTRQTLPLVLKQLNEVMLHPGMEAERPHVFTAQSAVFLRWLMQNRGAEERMELSRYLNVKCEQILTYALSQPQESGDWAGMVVLLLKAARRTFTAGGFDPLIARATAVASGPGQIVRSKSLDLLLRDDGRLTALDDTLWLDLADAFAAAALQERPREYAAEKVVMRPMGVEETMREVLPKDHVIVDRSPGPRESLDAPLESVKEPLVETPVKDAPPPVTPEVLKQAETYRAPPVPDTPVSGPTSPGEGGVFAISELGIKVTADGWLRDAQGLGGSVTLVQNNKRFIIQPEGVNDARQHLEATIQELRRVGFEVNENRFMDDGSGYDLMVSKAPLSQFVRLRRVGEKWLLITATTNSAEFTQLRPIFEAISDSIQPL